LGLRFPGRGTRPAAPGSRPRGSAGGPGPSLAGGGAGGRALVLLPSVLWGWARGAGRPATEGGQLSFPTAESLHPVADTRSVVMRLRPWLVISLLLIGVSYWAPLRQALRTPQGAPPYAPDNPAPLVQRRP